MNEASDSPIKSPGAEGANRPGGLSPYDTDPANHPGGPSAYDTEVAGLLRTAIHRLIKVLRREARNDAQLSLTERSTLSLLYQHGELLPSDIAKIEKVTTQSISQVINYLNELNYIQKTPSAEDKRKVLLSLTDAGKTYVEQVRKEKQEWLAHALHEKTSAEEKEQLVVALKIIARLADEDK
jgi:DNA-binding MarR family transcriptional regulator